MASKDLINLGISPDSGTGDSARRGGEKINNLFADVYSQFGDNPVGQDPTQPFYGYRRPFFEYEYKVGELHPAGRFTSIQFKTDTAKKTPYDKTWGHGYDQAGNLVDSDGDGIPNIYRDSEWYFLSRGEQIDADLTNVTNGNNVHFVLPLPVPGDCVIIRDGFATWENKVINIWTTPYEFQSLDQVTEWQTNTKVSATELDSESISIYDPVTVTNYTAAWHKVVNSTAISSVYRKLDQPFSLSTSGSPYNGKSPVLFTNVKRYQLEFVFSNYKTGWVMKTENLDGANIAAQSAVVAATVRDIDSDVKVFKNQGVFSETLSVANTLFIDSDSITMLDSDGGEAFSVRRVILPTNHDERTELPHQYTMNMRGNAIFGRDSDDVVVFNSRIMSNFIPYGPEIYSLGDSDNPWRDIHLAGNTIYLGSVKIKEVNGTIAFLDSDNQTIGVSANIDGGTF